MNSFKNTKPRWGHLAMLFANLIFGINAPIAKQVLSDPQISALALSTMRMIGTTTLFWIASFFVKKEEVCHKDMLRLFFASLLGVAINQFTFIYGLSLTSPIDASIVCTLTPIITMIIAAVYLKEPITGKKAGGIFIGALGALILILGSQHAALGAKSSMLGNVICLVSSLSYSFYLVLFKDLTQKYSVFTMMKWMFLYATICYIPISFQDLNAIAWQELPTNTIFGLIYVVVMATFVAYICIPIGQRTLRPTLVSMYGYLQPVVATSTAVFFGMDVLGWDKILAVLLVFTGVYVVNKSKSRAQMESEKKKQDQLGSQ